MRMHDAIASHKVRLAAFTFMKCAQRFQPRAAVDRRRGKWVGKAAGSRALKPRPGSENTQQTSSPSVRGSALLQCEWSSLASQLSCVFG